MTSNAEGGSFMSGFAAGAVSSLIASSVQIMGESSNVLSFYGRSGWSQNTTTALTIAAGGVSGGLSSTIAGGNFWAGARQGLITSGLNHVAHSTIKGGQENRLKNQIEKNLGSNIELLLDSEWGRERLIDILIDKVPIIRKEYLKSLKFNGKLKFVTHGENKGNTMAETAGNPGYATITFYEASLTDVFTFGEALHHELVHAYHHVSGIYMDWINKSGGESRGYNWYARAMSEYHAYEASYKVTGDLVWKYESENWLIIANDEYKKFMSR